jgi:uncharacterized RDD family membrane protein YckC
MPPRPARSARFSSRVHNGLRFSIQRVEIMAYADDKLIIDTPEQIPLEFALAGVGSRALALMLDTLIMFLGLVVLIFVGALVVGGLSSFWSGASNWAAAIFIFLFFLLQWGYFAISEILMKGQTFGKRLLNLRVIKDSGAPITAYDAIGRNLLRVVDAFPFLFPFAFYGIGIVAAMLNKRNKRLGDMVAGTVVVHERPLAEMQPVWALSSSIEGKEAPPSPYNVARLSVEELQLIEAFLSRRFELAPQLRIQTAFQIAARVSRTLEIPAEGRPDPETLLEILARDRRNMGRM